MRAPLALTLLLALGCRTNDKSDGADGALDSGALAFADDDGDGFGVDEDCDDSDAAIRPGATEICDGIDNNCDGQVDEGVTGTWYADADGDGYGDPDAVVESCEPPEGTVPNAIDCDDAAVAIYPGANELCDALDNDCDGEVDEGLYETWWADDDGDGYGDPERPVEGCVQPADSADNTDDCDDTNASIRPDAVEICNGIDDDCDGTADGPDAVDQGTWHLDADGDGYGDPLQPVTACTQPSNAVTDDTDCDDVAFDVNPAAAEVCNGIDDDCDGRVDDADSSVDLSTGSTFYTDADSDGYGGASAVQACAQPTGTTVTSTDCDDSTAAVSPAASEVCNSIDDDCDGLVDDDDSSVDTSTGSTFYADSDADGYGDAASTTQACSQPSGTVTDATDCDDSTSAVNPGATEICDGQDNDCDGSGDPMDGSDAACPATDCQDVLNYASSDGLYWIDPSGSNTWEAWCDLTTEGGGWTLAYVVSDDGQNTWTWDDRTLLSTDTTTVGTVSDLTQDYKSPGLHEIDFTDLLFLHEPSGTTAEYEAVGDGTQDLGSFIDGIGVPVCDFSMAGNGYPLTGGTLTLGGNLCDTDLYFNLGDHESTAAYCASWTSTYNHVAYGPVWSQGNNNGCPFDDPSSSALGPAFECPSCTSGASSRETRTLGFAHTLGLNTGSSGAGDNTMEVYVR